jgi:DnaJ-class molecular chaperone
MTCPTCKGTGTLKGRYATIECPECHGAAEVEDDE